MVDEWELGPVGAALRAREAKGGRKAGGNRVFSAPGGSGGSAGRVGAAEPFGPPTASLGAVSPAKPLALALVLIISQLRCNCCGHTWRNVEHQTFLRKCDGARMHWQVNKFDPILTRALPRETKEIFLEAEFCIQCFHGDPWEMDLEQKQVADFIENSFPPDPA